MNREATQSSESRVDGEENQNTQIVSKTRRPLRKLSPKQFRSIWRKALEVFYGNEFDARNWFYCQNSVLGGKPLDVLHEPIGRAWVMRELDWLSRQKFQQKPLTSWRSCRAFYPCHHCGMLLFRGTQLPATDLFEHLRDGGDIVGFVTKHPEISADQVDDVFDMIKLDLDDIF